MAACQRFKNLTRGVPAVLRGFCALIFVVAFLAVGPPLAQARSSKTITKAEAALAKGLYEEAIGHYEAARQSHPREALQGLLSLYEKIGDAVKIVETIEALEKIGVGGISLKLKKAIALRNLGGWEAAEEVLRQIRPHIGGDADALVEYGRYLLWQQDYHAATAMFQRALRVNPDATDAQLGLAYVDIWQERDKSAERRVDGILAKDPKHVDALILKGWLEAWRERFAPALRRFKAARRLAPDHPEVLRGLAQVYAWDGQHGASADYYEKISKLQPGNVDILLELGRQFKNAGNYTRAVAVLGEAGKLAPEREDILQELALARKWTDEIDANLRALKKRIALNQGELNDYVTLGLAYDWLGQLTESKKILETALAKNPDDIRVLFAHARVLERLGELEKAKKAYQRILTRKKDFIDAKLGLARIQKAFSPTLTLLYSYGLITTHDFTLGGDSYRNAEHGWTAEVGQRLTSFAALKLGTTLATAEDLLPSEDTKTYELNHGIFYLAGDLRLPGEISATMRYDFHLYNTRNPDANLFNLSGRQFEHGGYVLLSKSVGRHTPALQLSRAFYATYGATDLLVDTLDTFDIYDDLRIAENLSVLMSMNWSKLGVSPEWTQTFRIHPRYQIPFFPQATAEYEYAFSPVTSEHSHQGLLGFNFAVASRINMQLQYGLTYYTALEAVQHDGVGVVLFELGDWINLSSQTRASYLQQGLSLSTTASGTIFF